MAVPATAQTGDSPCVEQRAGGDWTRYGQDQLGQNRQDAEATIGTDNVASLQQIWSTGDSTGYESAPPIVAGGCVIINSGGRILAMDLDDGTTVWETQGVDTTSGFAVTVVDGRVHAAFPNNGKPHAAAFDVRDGATLWESEDIWFGEPANQLASAVVHDGIQVLFTTGPDFEPAARQGYALLDAATGEILHKQTTLTEDELAQGYNGGGVWGTPNVDPETDYLYAPTSNPESKTKEHEWDNAILKIDLARERDGAPNPNFGKVVGHYKGHPDSYTGYDNPVCQTVGEDAWVNLVTYGSSPTCGQLDVDFGVGPTLWKDADGNTYGAAPQKSGEFHVFNADTMEGVWRKQTFVTMANLNGGLGRAATDGETVYAVVNPGSIVAYDGNTGTEKWTAPVGLPIPQTGGNAALANGVLYWVSGTGLTLIALDAQTGTKLFESVPAAGSPSSPFGSLASSVVVAGNTVVANHGGIIAAYRLGEGGGGGGGPELPDAPAVPAAGAPVVAAPGSASAGYATPVAPLVEGGEMSFFNGDVASHDVVSTDPGNYGGRLFRSDLVGLGVNTPIEGVSDLGPGSYNFFCSLHPGMKGQIVVQGG
jgi:outer membrane protein assembly factor BamB